MPYTAQYNKLIEREEGISKTNIIPKNLYRITSYTYADGERKNLTGNKSAIIFVFGRDTHTLYAIKLNEVTIKRFFNWLSGMIIKKPDLNKMKELNEIIIKSDKAGRQLFTSEIKTKKIYNLDKPTYRTYTIKGISAISKIYLKKEVLSEQLGIPFKKEETTT